ncbi:hypothetical protein [Streptomyces roseolilacinus]|uniref:hypothetical protein n=1 Tax=Streptomyces roseolilacinus TaxID=66904 RepID=UPI00382DD10C
MTRLPLVVRERSALLLDEAARRQWAELADDPQLRIAELQRVSVASVGIDVGEVNIEAAFGLEYQADFDAPVTDPESGLSVSQYSARMLFASLANTGERPVGLIATSISPHPAAGAAASMERRQVRSLVAGAGENWQLAEEYALDQSGDLVDADGFWDAFRRCLGGCGTTCLTSLGGCLPLGALPAIIACLAATCGYCAAKCAACVACDCGWLCSALAGCCHT